MVRKFEGMRLKCSEKVLLPQTGRSVVRVGVSVGEFLCREKRNGGLFFSGRPLN